MSSELEEISAAITVRHIQTRIENVRRVVGDQDQGSVLLQMRAEQIDATPIFDAGGVAGWVRAGDLGPKASSVKQVIRPLTSALLVDAFAPLGALLSRLSNDPFLLVVDDVGISGVVTASDMNKQAGRTYLFLEISGLELSVAQLARESREDEGWFLARLPKDRGKKLQSRARARRMNDTFSDIAACLELEDLLIIASELFDISPWSRLRGTNGEGLRRKLVVHRNSVMHGVLNVVEPDGLDLHRLNEVVRLVRDLVDALPAVAPSSASPAVKPSLSNEPL